MILSCFPGRCAAEKIALPARSTAREPRFEPEPNLADPHMQVDKFLADCGKRLTNRRMVHLENFTADFLCHVETRINDILTLNA